MLSSRTTNVPGGESGEGEGASTAREVGFIEVDVTGVADGETTELDIEGAPV